jgi:hypothetical protein
MTYEVYALRLPLQDLGAGRAYKVAGLTGQRSANDAGMAVRDRAAWDVASG